MPEKWPRFSSENIDNFASLSYPELSSEILYPFIGESLALWIRGDYVISDATLNRFFAFHVIALPLLLFAVIYLHIAALHTVGSNNPDGVEIKQNKDKDGKPVDGIPFHPCLLYTSPSPRDRTRSRMPSSA